MRWTIRQRQSWLPCHAIVYCPCIYPCLSHLSCRCPWVFSRLPQCRGVWWCLYPCFSAWRVSAAGHRQRRGWIRLPSAWVWPERLASVSVRHLPVLAGLPYRKYRHLASSWMRSSPSWTCPWRSGGRISYPTSGYLHGPSQWLYPLSAPPYGTW